jgi:hypothetical protein
MEHFLSLGLRTSSQVAHSTARHRRVRAYLQSAWVKFGLGLLLLGAAPLTFIIVAAAIGLWPDPNPNPIGPGLLFFFAFWPAVICILIGVIRVRLRHRRRAA